MSRILQFASRFILHTWQSVSLNVLLLNGLEFTSLSFIDLPALPFLFSFLILLRFFGILSLVLLLGLRQRIEPIHILLLYTMLVFCLLLIFSCPLLRFSQNYPLYIGHSPFWSFSMIFSNLLFALLYTLTRSRW